jgi:N-carbamoyl-L-amino-acid hydrolase
VRVDRIGNVFLRRAGSDDSLPPVMTGSHLDTQPTGGKFDGNYGVLAGLEVIRTLDDHGIRTRAPLEVAIWTNEEGSRFVPVMMGSGVFAGAFTLEHATARATPTGQTVRQELERLGLPGRRGAGPAPGRLVLRGAHRAGAGAGGRGRHHRRREGVLGIRWFDCTVTGMEAHAGPTPMALRATRCRWPPKLMQEVVASAGAHPPHGRGTVGMVQVHPNSRNVIPGRVTFSIDLRNADRRAGGCAGRPGARGGRAAGAETGLPIELVQVSSYSALPFDAGCVQAVARAAAALGYSHMPAISGAGHDAIYMARLAPAGMIFIPCKDGISHNEIEDAKRRPTSPPAPTCCCR